MKDIIYQSDWYPQSKTTEISLKIGCDVVGHGGLTGSCIHDLEVKQEYRRQGFATEILRILVLMGGNWLWCDHTNIPAVKLYEKFGFEITALDGGFYRMCVPHNEDNALDKKEQTYLFVFDDDTTYEMPCGISFKDAIWETAKYTGNVSEIFRKSLFGDGFGENDVNDLVLLFNHFCYNSTIKDVYVVKEKLYSAACDKIG